MSGKCLVREIIDESGHANVREMSVRETSETEMSISQVVIASLNCHVQFSNATECCDSSVSDSDVSFCMAGL